MLHTHRQVVAAEITNQVGVCVNATSPLAAAGQPLQDLPWGHRQNLTSFSTHSPTSCSSSFTPLPASLLTRSSTSAPYSPFPLFQLFDSSWIKKILRVIHGLPFTHWTAVDGSWSWIDKSIHLHNKILFYCHSSLQLLQQ